MLRSIYEKLFGAFRTKSRRKPPHHTRPRRLALESLEGRKLLTVTSLTMNSISDGSFEAPALPVNAYQVLSPLGNPTAANYRSPWTFTGISGVTANGSGFTTGDPPAPSGAQVAFLQNNASISQSVSLDAGVYNLSLLAAQRINYQTQNQQIAVWIDYNTVSAQYVGTIVPNNPITNNNVSYTTSYATYETSNFQVTAGLHTVTLMGMAPAAATRAGCQRAVQAARSSSAWAAERGSLRSSRPRHGRMGVSFSICRLNTEFLHKSYHPHSTE